MKLKLSFLALVLAATPALGQMPSAGAWEIGPMVRGKNYSVGMPAHPSPGPGGSVVMVFPAARAGEVDAMTTAVGPLAGARKITLRYRVDAAPRTRFVAVETPNEPATVSLYFQQAGDNWSARGRFASYRWYAPAHAVIPLTTGEYTVTVPLNDAWTNVAGQSNIAVRDGFVTALQNTARLGIAFGSSSRRSHGVYATGPARFTLLSLDIE